MLATEASVFSFIILEWHKYHSQHHYMLYVCVKNKNLCHDIAPLPNVHFERYSTAIAESVLYLDDL